MATSPNKAGTSTLRILRDVGSCMTKEADGSLKTPIGMQWELIPFPVV